jgi:glycosyltransferase involved in cell wall biosynthesis
MNPMKGGIAQGVHNMVPELQRYGISTEVVSLDSPKRKFIHNHNFTIHAVGEAEGLWGYNKNLLSWLEENLSRFDIIIIDGLWQYYTYAVYKSLRHYKKRNLVKVYVMPHGMLDPWFQHAKGRKLKAIRNWIYWKLIEKFIVHEADGLLFTCQEELKMARQTFVPYAPREEVNIGYGIKRPPVYTPLMKDAFLEKCFKVTNIPYILFLSRIDPKKGVDLLIKAYTSLKQEGYSLPDLVIAGPGLETNYGQFIKKQASEDQNIHFPGMLDGDAKWGAFYGCETFVLPSHQENFGIAVVEALACGKPVLISNKVNIFEEISSSGGGFVDEDTLLGTKNIIKRWIELELPKRTLMSVQATKTFENHFNVSHVAKNTASFLIQSVS